MSLSKNKFLICSCERSMPLDDQLLAKTCGVGRAADQLCGSEIATARKAMQAGDPLTIACTQAIGIFEDLREELGVETPLRFVNIRERAGWSDEAAAAQPKIAALLAESQLRTEPTASVSLKSAGVALIYARDEQAFAAAQHLADKLDLTVLIDQPHDLPPPADSDIPVLKGRIVRASGHLGAFELTVDDFAEPAPSSRASLRFGPGKNGAKSRCDIILDLSGRPPLFPAHEARDGYLRADPGNPLQLAGLLLKAADLVGEFEKPRYIDFHAELCAYSRSQRIGCTRCLDVCPTGAIAPGKDSVLIDPFVCAGCGSCAAVCPTGAADYRMPAAAVLAERLRILAQTYFAAGGENPVLLIHDQRYGAPLLDLLARAGRGLPARVIPFAVNEVSEIGLDLFASALAYGFGEVRLLVTRQKREHLAGLAQQMGVAEAAFAGLGLGSGRVQLIEADEPDAVERAVWDGALRSGGPPASFLPMGERRTLARRALKHLQASAPEQPETIGLPKGAAFGEVAINVEGCTLCLACVAVCPTGALSDSPDRPSLSFTESACVQCGLCKSTCPEKVISLQPRLNFRPEADSAMVKKSEEPYCCIQCGKPFGTKASIERIIEKLQGKHWMYADAGTLDRLRMCGDCRIVAQTVSSLDPYAGPARPQVRMPEDYLGAPPDAALPPKAEDER